MGFSIVIYEFIRCLVFSISCLVFVSLTSELTSYRSDEKQNTKHQTLDEFDFLRIHQFFIAEFERLRKIEQIVDINI